MDGVEPEHRRRRRWRQRLPGRFGHDPSHELNEPGATGVDDARVTEDIEQFRCSRKRALPLLEDHAQ